MAMKSSLAHLPEAKQSQVQAIADLLRAEASVEMVILFGSHARGDWVDDAENLYFSDFDLLAVVGTEKQAHDLALWSDLSQRARQIAGRTPVSLIAHDIKEINHEIRLGQYFFIDILREGIVLYTSRKFALATPKALTPADRLDLGLLNFRYWFASATEFWRGCGYYAGRGQRAHAAFLLHQAVERYFHSVLLVFTGYKPKTHDIEKLAKETAPLHPALAGALPRTEPEDAARWDLLRRAYIEARYSKSYAITFEELRILREQVLDLAVRVRAACVEKLGSFCGPDKVGVLPDVPQPVDLGDLPEAPATDDPNAFDAWREALMARTFEKGEQHGELRGLVGALLTVLSARGLAVDAAERARIEACVDAGVLKDWLARASAIDAVDELFSAEPGGEAW